MRLRPEALEHPYGWPQPSGPRDLRLAQRSGVHARGDVNARIALPPTTSTVAPATATAAPLLRLATPIPMAVSTAWASAHAIAVTDPASPSSPSRKLTALTSTITTTMPSAT